MNPIGKFMSIVLIAVLGACAAGAPDAEQKREAPLFNDLGDYHHSITTDNAMSQRFFDQGLILSYGFNHAEAERSFREAARLDPDCAMCYWGTALVLGPNINAPMKPESVPRAYKAIQRALKLAPKATEKERAYIEALSKRYMKNPPRDRSSLDRAYADAMRDLPKRFPEDLDAATLFAESLMDVHPWDYWTKDGKAKPWTPELLSTLESVLSRAPDHPRAHHRYIHTVEASEEPQRAEPYAERLGDLVPGASHLVHMPSHIFIRVGRYHDASLSNERALEADQSYIAQCHAQGIYPLAYMPHNAHFLWYAAAMEGRSALSLKAAGRAAKQVDRGRMTDPMWGPLMQQFSLLRLYALTRFGKWDDILREPNPLPGLSYPTGAWHFARGMALAAKGQPKKADQELRMLKKVTTEASIKAERVWGVNTTEHVLLIASEVLAGELAAKAGAYERAIGHLETAVGLEDDMTYIEPPDWFYPVRQSLGAVLLAADQPAAAERAYREDLDRNPENGWSLFGLKESLNRQGKVEKAREVEERFNKAWAWADVTLHSSRF